MSLMNTTRQRTIDSFATHEPKGSKRVGDSLCDAVVCCLANNSKISLNEVKRLRKARKY